MGWCRRSRPAPVASVPPVTRGGRHAPVPPSIQGGEAAHASAVAVANGRAYVRVGDYESGSDALLAYATGSFQSPALWQAPAGCGSTSPTVHLGIVFVGSSACRPSGDDGGVRAVDAASGQLLWYSHQLGIGEGAEDAGNVAATSGAVYVSIYANTVYGGDNALLSLDARTGAVRWQVAGVFGDPAVAGGRVLVGAANGQLQARSAATGALLWSRPGDPGWGSPTVTGGVVYALGTENGATRLFARRADTGALRWKRALSGQLTGAWLAVAGGRVLATTSAGISAFDPASGTPPLERGRHRSVVTGGRQRAGVRRAGPGHRRLASVRRGAALGLRDSRLRGAGGLGRPPLRLGHHPGGRRAGDLRGPVRPQVTGTVSGTPNLRQYCLPDSGRVRMGS